MIKNCKVCGGRAHTQDELHGKGNRVFNESQNPKTKANVRRCTVCGNEEVGAAQVVVEELAKGDAK